MGFQLLGLPSDRFVQDRINPDLAQLGIGVEGDFDFSALPAEIQEALKAGVKEGFAEIETFIAEYTKDPLGSAKTFGTREFLTKSGKENYKLDRPDLLRCGAAHTGLYGNSAAEAIYPAYFVDADKEPLDGSKQSYTLSFGKSPCLRPSRSGR